MKELKMKDLVLEHYRKVYETEMDGVTVRVWKPRTMGKLPTYAMLGHLKVRARDASEWAAIERDRKVQWWLGNPDYGAWDAQLVRRFDPRKMTLDIYFAALLIRPFSKQAYDWYEAHSTVYDPVARLCLMWDSREFDRNGCFDTSFGAYGNQKEVDKYLYSGVEVGPFECMTDPKFDVCFSTDEDDDDDIKRRCVKLRYEDGQLRLNATLAHDEPFLEDDGTNHVKGIVKDCARNFEEFRKQHPEVTEMHYYTDEEVIMDD
jgi:hypothetical protein